MKFKKMQQQQQKKEIVRLDKQLGGMWTSCATFIISDTSKRE